MVEAEAKPEAAIKERRSQDRDQRQRVRWLGMIAASYLVDTLFLALFAMAGTISGTVALAYGAAAAAITGGNYALIASGWTLTLREPSLVKLTMILGVAMQLAIVLAAP